MAQDKQEMFTQRVRDVQSGDELLVFNADDDEDDDGDILIVRK